MIPGAERESGDEFVQCRIDATLAELCVDDGRVNAINGPLCREVDVALDAIESNADVSALILRGRPGCFSAGLDLKRLPKLAPEQVYAEMDLFVALMERLFLFPKPIVALSEGHAMAGGFVWLLTSDLRVAVDDDAHRYGMNEVANGVPLVGGNAAICQAAIASQHQVALLLHGRISTAAEMLSMGVFHELAETSEVALERARALALGLDPLDARAYRATKRSMRTPALELAKRNLAENRAEMPSGNPLAHLEGASRG